MSYYTAAAAHRAAHPYASVTELADHPNETLSGEDFT
jgi:hypothetical protein